MARQRFQYTQDGGYAEDPSNQEDGLPNLGGNDPATSEPGPAPAPMEKAGPAPSEDPGPGPNSSPAPQGGNPRPPAPPPPAVASALPSIQGSEATGGVQGSFAQAGERGSRGLTSRFGQPASWFRGAPGGSGNSPFQRAWDQSPFARVRANRDATTRAGGNAGGGTVTNVPEPSSGSEGGGENDEEFQRMLRAAMTQRFGSGGRA